MGHVVTLVNEIRGCLSELAILRGKAVGVYVVDPWLKKINDIEEAFKNISIMDKIKQNDLLQKTPELRKFCFVFALLQSFVLSLCDKLKISAANPSKNSEWGATIDAMRALYAKSESTKESLESREIVACSYCDVFMSVFVFDYETTKNDLKDYDSRKEFVQQKLVSTGAAMQTFDRTLFRYSDDDESNEPNQLLFREIDLIISALLSEI